jgi:hypothetical protein
VNKTVYKPRRKSIPVSRELVHLEGNPLGKLLFSRQEWNEHFPPRYVIYRASHIRVISEFILYATKNTNDADYLIPFIM